MDPENTRFNARVYIDFLYIDGATVLYMVGHATHFSATKFFYPRIIEPVWVDILKLRETVYIGFLNILVFDGGSPFRDTYFRNLLHP